ncbi:AGC family protein serine/threonine kinase domain-containing protein [Mucor ambiguus]|uniref:AGC family protein serine/threonine kinase domain-containing protein n=1 Tax=Mucor ambiguus TaxID=91626 RepID=A0A0C9N012_9FUNG|nr:AGC family protein serine/threonine kinase domain-containing protein [Mucor ambiguus]
MSAVFEFDDLPSIHISRSATTATLEDISESGYSSEVDATEPTQIPLDEKLYEVPLAENFISSSLSTPLTRDNRKVSLDDFEILKLLGRGAYGKVMLCRHKESGILYAMKVLKKASLFVHAKNAEHTKAERQILEEVRNPFIVQLFYAFQTNDRLYLILEYATGGELFTHMASEHMFTEDVARFYLAELLLALEHLHGLGIVYRDLKPENCLLDGNGHALLTDFGLSKVSIEGSRTNTVCGTAEYMAPEILLELSYDKSVDYWTFGILMYEMLTGYTPFRCGNKKKTLDAILKKKLQIPYYISSDAKDLLIRLLRKNPNVRLGHGEDGMEKLKNHRFFRKIDWKELKMRTGTPPIQPIVTDPSLAENFDEEFTNEIIKESPIDGANLDAKMQDYFLNFSYVAQSNHLVNAFEK